MTTDNQKKYEEAAKECASKVLGIPAIEIRDDDTIVYGFLAGASFAEKEGHNAAIDKALKLLSEYKLNNVIALVLFEKELEKLKI